MSNKTQLQTNNASLEGYISRVNAAKEVAATLPDAGGAAEPVIEALEISENGTYTAFDGVDGYSPIIVNIPVPDGYIQPIGELEVTENGTHDVTTYASVNVNVPTGGGAAEDLNATLTEQEELITTLKETLKNKASEEINKGLCTVNIIPPSSSNYYVCRETVDGDGVISYGISRSYTSGTISVQARCDSIMYIQASTIKSVEATDGEVLYLNSGHGIAYKTPSLNNSIVQVTLGG